MIRITELSQSDEEVVLKVEGWLAGADVELLEEEGTRWLQQTDQLVLSLKGLQSIDPDGIQLLQRWAEEGVVLKDGSTVICILLASRGLLVQPEETA